MFHAVLLAIMAGVFGVSAELQGAAREIRLRFAWGGGQERQWKMQVDAQHGVLTQLTPLGIEPDENRAMWLEENRVSVQQPTPRSYEAFEVTIQAEELAELRIGLVDQLTQAKPIETTLKIAELLRAPYNSALDEQGNRLFVTRAPGDLIDVRMDRKHLIYSPEEPISLSLLPRFNGELPGDAKIKVVLRHARDTKALWSHEYSLAESVNGSQVAAIPITMNAPNLEGAYQFDIELAQPGIAERFVPVVRQRLIGNRVLGKRGLQFLVLSPSAPVDAPNESEAVPWKLVAEIDPANPGWWNRLVQRPQFALIPGWPQGPLRSGPPQFERHGQGQMVKLAAAPQDPEPAWEAYPLPIDQVGRPHIVEVEFPADLEQRISISIVEPDAAGNVLPIGIDTAVTVSRDLLPVDAAPNVQRVIFWPRTPSPLIRITQGGKPASLFRRVRVYAGPERLPHTGAFPQLHSRTWGGFWGRPLLPENFNATQQLDEASGQSIDDWQTFYEAGTRLVEYLKYTERNAAMMSVLAEGSSVYPSAIVAPSPRYDTGRLGLMGNDPVRKDGLEMLFRLFERERLVLVPSIQFSSPLPELEAQLRQGGAQAIGLAPVDSNGRAWTDSNHPHRGMAPYYNPLDQRVQAAMLAVVRELIQRYRQHGAWGGLALQLDAFGYAQLPGAAWGFDDVTVSRFERESGIRVPGDGDSRYQVRAEALLGPLRQTWLEWRAAILAEFYAQIQHELDSTGRDLPLYLVPGDLFEAPEQQAALRPSLIRKASVDSAMLEMGIDLRRFGEDSGIVAMRPRRLGGDLAPEVDPLRSQLDSAIQLDRTLSSSSQRAALFYAPPRRQRLASFDAKSPFGQDRTYTMMVIQDSSCGANRRREFIRSLSGQDPTSIFDGGWFASLGQEHELHSMIRAFKELPASRFSDSPASKQPIHARRCATENGTYLYFLNESPWKIEASIRLSASLDCQWRRLGVAPDWELLSRDSSGPSIRVAMEGFDFVAVQLSDAESKILDINFSEPDGLAAALEGRIRELSARADALPRQPALSNFTNGGFEDPQTDVESIPGWTLHEPSRSRLSVDADSKHGGEHSIVFSSSGRLASLESDWFEAPTTGRLAFSVWMRTENLEKQPLVQLAVVGKTRDEPIQRFAQVGGAADRGVPLKDDWTSYVFQIDDLPTARMQQMQVRFDLIGKGEVWIDDVEIFPLSFTKDERIEISKIVVSASGALDSGRWSDCLHLLEGYWPNFLMHHVTVTENDSILSARAPEAASRPTTRSVEEKPGFVDRVRGYLPKWRF
ncbi:MAG: hypothetical protein KDA42_03295 [Planctomycetales bacterium]|nr:hypothetical protein [Planctomycetales bacterium]